MNNTIKSDSIIKDPSAIAKVTNVRRAGISGDQILADVNGVTEFVRKSGGSKYSFVSVQIGHGKVVHIQPNRTAKSTPYSKYFQVVEVLPIAD
jgi:hypothetical protein